MNDDSQTPPVSDDPNAKSPLDALEELLAQTQAATSNPDAASQTAAQPVADAEVAPATPNVDLEQQARLEAERLMAQEEQGKIDEAEIIAQRQALESVKDTPEYQARTTQMQEDHDQAESEEAVKDGFDIKQLDHTQV
jgi:hypothetical protein